MRLIRERKADRDSPGEGKEDGDREREADGRKDRDRDRQRQGSAGDTKEAGFLGEHSD